MTVPARRSPGTKSTRSTGTPRGSSRSSGSRGKSAAQMEREAARVSRNLQETERRAAEIRAKNPTRDPGGVWHTRIRVLADQLGLEVGDILDEWDERAAIREYLGEHDREEANRLAFYDVKDRLVPQRELLP